MSVVPIVEKHHGRSLSRGGKVMPMSGDGKPERIVIIESFSPEDMQRFFSCPEFWRLLPSPSTPPA